MSDLRSLIESLLALTSSFVVEPTEGGVGLLEAVCKELTAACRDDPARVDVAEHEVVKLALVPILELTLAKVISREVMAVGVEEAVWLRLQGITDMELLVLAQGALRCMRNACPGSKVNQAALVEAEVPERICAVLSVVNKVMTGSEKWNEGVKLLTHLGLQLMCNVVVENRVTRDLFMQRRYPKRLLLAALENEVVGFKLLRLCALLINTCAADEAYCRGLVRQSEKEELSAVLQVAQLSNPELFEGNGGKLDDEEGEGEAAATFEVCSWIVGKIVDKGMQHEALEVLDEEDKAVLLSMWLYHINEDIWQSSGHEAMSQLVGYYEELLKAKNTSIKPLVLKILATYSAQDVSYTGGNQEQSVLLRCVLAELESGSQSFGYKSELMRVVANVCMRRKANQDFVRMHNNGMLTVLNNVNVDDNNPFVREWGVFAIRNLCEGNAANQELIRELRVQGVADNGVLEKAGLSVELTPDGKPKVVKRQA